jgi:hypothetical protein
MPIWCASHSPSGPPVELRVSVLELADPDVAKTDGIAVVLHGEGEFVGMGFVLACGVGTHPASATAEDGVVLDEHSVVQHGEGGSASDLACFVEEWAVENDVIGLPLTGLAADVDERFLAAVECAGLAIGIGDIVVVIEDLDLIGVHEENAAVAAALAVTFDAGGGCPLDVNLAGAEFLLGLNVTGFFDGLECSIDDFPAAGAALGVGPVFGECLFRAIEKHDGIGWRCAEHAHRTGSDNRREGLFQGIGFVNLDAVDVHIEHVFAVGTFFGLGGDDRFAQIFVGVAGKEGRRKGERDEFHSEKRMFACWGVDKDFLWAT